MSISRGNQDGAEQVFPRRFDDRWEDRWFDELRRALRRAAETLAASLGVEPHRFGILPAVYFPRLRMGSVMYQDWGASKADTTLAMPWDPKYIPPPFTCFAPPIEEAEEPQVWLITRVASFVDRLFDRTKPKVPNLAEMPNGMSVGTVTWIAETDSPDGVVDADQLLAAEFAQVSATYAIPFASNPSAEDPPPLYVPMLYVQSADRYAAATFDALIHAAARAAGATPDTQPIYDALMAVARAARLRASQWLNPKTHLLNQAGFDGLKDDLQRRVAAGELYAECFFDIDEFKAKNDQFGYVGADLIAAELVDRVLLAVQRSVAEEYAAFRKKREVPYNKPNGFRALLAHVSGDEFKFFVRSNLTASAPTEIEVGRAQDIANVIVAASAARESSTSSARLDRMFARFTPTTLFENREIVADVRATVSLGLAVVSTDGSWPISENDFNIRHFPIDEQLLRRARTALDELDGLAERAIFGAKRVPSKILLSIDLLASGGRLSVPVEGKAKLLLGWMDGLLEGDAFDVFETSARDGSPSAVIRVDALSESDRRTASVRFIEHTVKGQQDHYHTRLRPTGFSQEGRFVTAVLKKN